MAMISLAADETAKPRFARLCDGARMGRNEALGMLVQFWAETRRTCLEAAPPATLAGMLPIDPALADGVIATLLQAGYLKASQSPCGDVHIVDNTGLAQRRAKRRADGAAAGSKSRVKKRGRPKADKPPAPAPALALAQDVEETRLQAACRATWAAYVDAYHARTGQVPVRNAKTSALTKQFVQRVGQAEAPRVVAFYVQHPSRAYVERLWPLEMAVRDAEPLRTQWANGRPITRGGVEQFEAAATYESQRQRILNGDI